MEQINVIRPSKPLRGESNLLDYAIVLFIIAGTGFEWCFRYNEMIFFWIFPLSLILYLRRNASIDLKFLLFISLYIIWASFQAAMDISIWSALINFGIRLAIYYLAVISVRGLPSVIIKTVYWICVISLIMYVICLIPSVRSLFRQLFSGVSPIAGFTEDDYRANPGQTMIFYFLPSGFGEITFRNSGPFWEPGMFAVFINIALAMQIIRDRNISRETVIFTLASVSTLSTTSLVATIFIYGYYFTFIHRKASSVFLLFVLGIGLIAFLNSDFGLAKMQQDVYSDKSYSRFGAIFYHLSLIERHPWIGNGFDSNNTFKFLTSPNGLSLVFVFWGIPMGCVFYILLYNGVKNLALSLGAKKESLILFLFIVFLIVVFSQGATNRHFYYAIMMLGLHDYIRPKIKGSRHYFQRIGKLD